MKTLTKTNAYANLFFLIPVFHPLHPFVYHTFFMVLCKKPEKLFIIIPVSILLWYYKPEYKPRWSENKKLYLMWVLVYIIIVGDLWYTLCENEPRLKMNQD